MKCPQTELFECTGAHPVVQMRTKAAVPARSDPSHRQMCRKPPTGRVARMRMPDVRPRASC